MKFLLFSSFLLFLVAHCFGQDQTSNSTSQRIDSAIVSLEAYKVPGQMEAGLALLEPYFDSIRFCCGDHSYLMAKALIIRADFSREMGRFEPAVNGYVNSLAILNTIDSSYSRIASSAMLNLGLTHILYGDPRIADSVLTVSLSICEVLYGKESALYVRCLTLLAKANLFSGNFDKAIAIYLAALDILQGLPGENDFDKLVCHNGLGASYVEAGQPEKALYQFQESARMNGKIYGMNHLNYAGAMMGLGNTYRALDQLGHAEKCILQAMTIYKANVPPERRSGRMLMHYLSLLQNLSSVYHDMGKIEKGYLLAAEADSLCRASSTPFPLCSGIAVNKAHMLKYLGRYSEAESLYFEAIQKNETEFGKDHYYYVSSVLSLAMLYIKAEEDEKAKPLVAEACSMYEKMFGREDKRFLVAYSQLGIIDQYLGDPVSAESILQYCVEVSSKSAYTDYTTHYSFLQLLSVFYHQNKKDSLAGQTYKSLMEVLPSNYIRSAQYASEREFLTLEKRYTKNIHQFQSFLLDHLEEKELWGLNHNLVLLTKSFLLNNRLKLQASLNTMEPSTRESYQDWRRLQHDIYTYIQEEDVEVAVLSAMESKSDSIEVGLFAKMPALAESYAEVNWKAIKSKLSANEAAIEILRIPYYDPEPTSQVRYAASIISSANESPVLVPLCTEKELLSLMPADAGTKASTINTLYSFAFNGQALYHLAWAPMLPYLQGIHKIYLSSDGLFHRINIDAIPTDEKKYLNDTYTLIHITDTRSITPIGDFAKVDKEEKRSALVMGGLKYDRLPETAEDQSTGATNQLRGEIDLPGLKDITWPYLKYSEEEAISVDAMLTRHGYTSTLLKGEYGTKEAFRNAGRWDNPEGVPHLLHLSTHGYFYPETPDETIEDISGTGLAYNISNHPMLRTGLIFAGVNLPENPEENSDRQTEGILTAYEISQLNLAQTDLVVLSACETGLGDIKGSEGVYGLQRAFKIAGAKQIISSLWQVPDFQTYELMDFFYKGYLEENMSPREALTYARDKMRKKRYEPFYWAGFVLME